MESLYAWFTTFTTIAFRDYIHLDSFARKATRGEIPDYRVVSHGLISSFLYIIGFVLIPVFWAALLTRWRI